ncbi:hypothetical protein Tco_0378458 [Tanacetum coccineum]
MLAKQNDPISKENKFNSTPINYVELNQLSEDFGKRFVPQQELYAEQDFWLQTLHPNTDHSDILPVKIEAPRELPKTLKDIFNVFDKDLLDEITEVQTVFNQMEAAVQQCSLQEKDTTINKLRNHIKSLRESDKKDRVKHDMDEIETINIELEHSVAKLLSENELLHKEIEHLKKIYKDQFGSIKKTCALYKEHCDSLIAQLNSNFMEHADLKGQIQEKVFVTRALQN